MRFFWANFILVLGLFFLLLLAVSFGAVKVDWLHLGPLEREILFKVRLPRVLMAALIGGALSLSGVLFQYVMKNPLADSFTTGVSASAAMGGVLAILFGLTPFLPILALAAGLAGLIVVYRLSSLRGEIQPLTMLLAGIIINIFASAIISLVKYLSEDSVSSIIFWLMGGFQWASWTRVIILALAIAVSALILYPQRLALDLLAFDDLTAQSSGVDLPRLRRLLFFLATFLTAISVSYAGIIGFVGLIVPHLIRLSGFIRAQELLPLSLLFGMAFMVGNDLLARTILPGGQELPVGIITSSLGGLFFLYLLLKKKRELYGLD